MIVFKPHAKPVYAVAFSPDGQHLATSSADGTVAVTALSDNSAERTLPGSTYCCPLAFSPGGELLARGGRGVAVWAWGDSAEKPLFEFKGAFTEGLAFSPDGKTLAGQSSDNPLNRWAVPSGEVLPGRWGGTRAESGGQQFPTGCLAYSPDGATLATSFGVSGTRGYDSVVFLWDATTGTLRGRLYSEFLSAHPTAIAFSPDGDLLAGVYGPAVNVFDVGTCELVATAKPGTKHFKGLVFTPNGQRLVTVSNDKTVRVWDRRTLTECAGYEWKIGKLGAIGIAPDGLRMAAGGDTGKVVVWDVDE